MKQYSAITVLFAGVNALKYVPENASIDVTKGIHYTVPEGWKAQGIPGHQSVQPDTGDDDGEVISNTNGFNAVRSRYVPESASIDVTKGIHYTVPEGWKAQGIPGHQSVQPDSGDDDGEVISGTNGFNAVSSNYVPENASVNPSQGIYYTVPEGWKAVGAPEHQDKQPDAGPGGHGDNVLVEKKFKPQSLSTYIPVSASINDDKGLYYTVPGSWSGKQIPGRGFERPDTGLDDETVLSKKHHKKNSHAQASSSNRDRYHPDYPYPTYYDVPHGFESEQLSGQKFEQPDTGLDDETVLNQKHHKKHKHHRYVPESASINGDRGIYYTVPGDWKGQQIPGQKFERPDTGLNDDTVLRKNQQQQQSVNSRVQAHSSKRDFYTVPEGWKGQQIPGQQFEKPDTGLDDETVLKRKQQKKRSADDF